jgi:hypothetical protein
MTRPADTLRMQADLASLLSINNGAIGNIVESVGKHYGKHYGITIQGGRGAIFNQVRYGKPYHVEPDMVDLVANYSEFRLGVSEVDCVSNFPPPARIGWCVLGKPLQELDRLSKRMNTVALSWGPSHDRNSNTHGTLIVQWANDILAPDDVTKDIIGYHPSSYADVRRETNGWAPNNVLYITSDTRIGLPRLYPTQNHFDAHGIVNTSGTLNPVRVMCALWELMGQTLASHRYESADRATRRLAKRAKISEGITVVTLRRESKPTEHPGTGTPLGLRVAVDGYYRTQHYGPGLTMTKRVFVASHERGPEGAPYSQRKTVYNLAR